MKDPAVLFYFQDFLVGTELMTHDEVGMYIRILCHLADKKVLNMKQLRFICRGDVPECIMEKMQQDGEGNYYQHRMQEERAKRTGFVESRRANAKRMHEHKPELMDDVNENVNRDIDKDEKRNYRNIPPPIEEIKARMAERAITAFSADAFFAFYESKGWKVGNSTMKNWDAALTTWNNREHETMTKPPAYAPKYKTYDEMCQLALNNKDIWTQMVAVKLPDMPKTVWAHPNDIVKHNLTQYLVQ